jgi:hypothetical protein
MIAQDEIDRLTSISREETVKGPPPMSTPIAIHDGYVYGLCPGDPESGSYVHAGVRAGWAPQPIEGGLLLALWGGVKAAEGYEEEGIVAFLTVDGLRRLAADLTMIADCCDAMHGGKA